MDVLIEKLHSAARSYCINRYADFQKQYGELQATGGDRIGPRYTDEALDVFPRYIVLKAILDEIERFTPHDFSTLDEAKEYIILCARTAEDIFTKDPHSPIQQSAMAEERALFIQFILTLTPNELLRVEPLLFRRVLTSSETENLRLKLSKRWPSSECTNSATAAGNGIQSVVCFSDKHFHQNVGTATIQKILLERGIERLWELREWGPSYELEPAGMDLEYDGVEASWFSEGNDWVISSSHEDFIAVGGWILEEIKKTWSGWGMGILNFE